MLINSIQKTSNNNDIDEGIDETADRGVITFSLPMLILGADVAFISLLSP